MSWLLRAALVAAAYFAAGRLALLMAIPPGYATAVWPAAGIALIACLRWGHRVVPGVVLGSFAVNVGTGLDASSTEAVLRSLAVAFAIGSGAALQAVIGARLIRRHVGADSALDRERDILLFLLLGGPVACITGATCGVTSLLASGAIAPSGYLFSWWTWWVGDTIGTLIFAPIVLAFLATPRERWLPRRTTVGLPLVLGFAAVTLLFVRVSSWENERLEGELARTAAAVEGSLGRRIEQSLDAVESVATTMQLLPDLTPVGFEGVVRRLHARIPWAAGFSWNPRVLAGERAAFEAAARASYAPGYAITGSPAAGSVPAPAERPELFPVLYVEPKRGNLSAVGFDISSERVRAAALHRARATGEVTATAPLRLVQDGRDGFLIAAPVFALPGRASATRPAGALLGFAIGVFRISDLIAAALRDVDRRGVVVAIEDVTSPIRTSRSELAGAARTGELRVADRTWRVALARAPGEPIARSWAAWIVLAGGLSFVGALGAMLLIVVGRAGRFVEAEARYRDLYEQSPDMYVAVEASDGVIVDCNATLCRVLGFAKTELLGTSMFELYAAGSATAARALFSELRAGGTASGPGLQLRRHDGQLVDVSLSMTAQRDGAGRIVLGRAVWRDVSEVRRLDLDREFLVELGERLSAAGDVTAIARETTVRLADRLAVARCMLSELAGDQVTVHEHARVGWAAPRRVLPRDTVIRAGLGEVLDGRRVVVDDTSRDERTRAAYAEVFAQRSTRAVLGVPIMRGAACVGSLAVADTEPRSWTARDVGLVHAAAERAWVWIEQRRVEGELRRMGEELERRVEQRTRALADSESRFRSLFADSPISLWEEDFGPVRAYLDELAATGVTDLAAHLRADPACVAVAAARVRILSVNEATLEIFDAGSEAELLVGLPQIFGPETLVTFRDELIALLEGRTRFEAETTVRTLTGRAKAISFRLTVIPGHEATWSRIVVSVFDLTSHRDAEAAVRAALREKEVLLKEIHHRVKNNLQVISSLLSLQAQHVADAELGAKFAESQARVQSIALVHERLYQSRDLARVALGDYLSTLADGLLHAHNAAERGVHAEMQTGQIEVPVDVAIPCGLIVNELVTNALKYAFPGERRGRITITIARLDAGRLRLAVDDDGVGLPAGFDPRTTRTLGLDLVFTFAEQLDAAVEVSAAAGTSFAFSFPFPTEAS